jgi:hypothetical protein
MLNRIISIGSESLLAEIERRIDKLKSTYGVLLFLYSVLLTRVRLGVQLKA